MINQVKQPIIFFIIICLFSSCVNRNLVYLSDLQNDAEYRVSHSNINEPEIQPGDLLGITVHSLNQQTNVLFNTGVVQTTSDYTYSNPNVNSNKIIEGYYVNKSGDILFPVLGQVKLGGLTKDEAIQKMTLEIKKHTQSAIVDIKYLNFKITVIGEVNRPSSFTIANEKINIFEALGLAGDMTPYGKRENVLLIREKDGESVITRINLNKKDVLRNPNFYLQQNDIIYVEPDKAKALQTSARNSYLPLIVSVSSVIVLILSRFY
ncbi:polysaccharide biosynthesis/export family protein [Pontibacter populi]|uniref:Polysaccharide biosynthesis/export family protein n=1 Tax=Pontibacter populi TaxID=890055 RepID=A0ABV1RX43_9BACT